MVKLIFGQGIYLSHTLFEVDEILDGRTRMKHDFMDSVVQNSLIFPIFPFLIILISFFIRKASRGQRQTQSSHVVAEHQSTQSQSIPGNQSTEAQSTHSQQSSNQSANPSWGSLFVNRQTFVELHLM